MNVKMKLLRRFYSNCSAVAPVKFTFLEANLSNTAWETYKYLGSDSDVTVPNTFDSLAVLSVGNETFMRSDNNKSPNLVDPSATIPGYQNSNGTIHTPGSGQERTTDFIPFTQKLYYIISGTGRGNINWCFYDENKTCLSFRGGNFPPLTGSITPTSACRYIRISWTDAINRPICVTTDLRSSFIPYDTSAQYPTLTSATIQNGIKNIK